MDILSRERPAKLEYQYLSAQADQKKLIQKVESTDEDLFPIQVAIIS